MKKREAEFNLTNHFKREGELNRTDEFREREKKVRRNSWRWGRDREVPRRIQRSFRSGFLNKIFL